MPLFFFNRRFTRHAKLKETQIFYAVKFKKKISRIERFCLNEHYNEDVFVSRRYHIVYNNDYIECQWIRWDMSNNRE